MSKRDVRMRVHTTPVPPPNPASHCGDIEPSFGKTNDQPLTSNENERMCLYFDGLKAGVPQSLVLHKLHTVLGYVIVMVNVDLFDNVNLASTYTPTT